MDCKDGCPWPVFHFVCACPPGYFSLSLDFHSPARLHGRVRVVRTMFIPFALLVLFWDCWMGLRVILRFACLVQVQACPEVLVIPTW